MKRAQINKITGLPVDFPKKLLNEKFRCVIFEKEQSELLQFENNLADELKNKLGDDCTFTFFGVSQEPTKKANIVKNNKNGKWVYLNQIVLNMPEENTNPNPLEFCVNYCFDVLKD